MYLFFYVFLLSILKKYTNFITLLLFLISIRPNGMLFYLVFCYLLLLLKKRKIFILEYLFDDLINFIIPVINFLNTYLNELNLQEL